MEIDDPTIPEFAHYRSYFRFAHRVRRVRRYGVDRESRAFIDTVLATAPKRILPMSQNLPLYRAQIGVDEQESTSGIVPHGHQRMLPDAKFVSGGRANPAGIAYLYLATSDITAVSEIRPWIGAHVSLAEFKLARDLKALDLSRQYGQSAFSIIPLQQIIEDSPVDADTKEAVVWADIDNAFSTPVSRSDEGIDYVPTQILAESFVEAGYDAIAYRSQFGNPGFNVVLFDKNDAGILKCKPVTIEETSLRFDVCGNEWYTAIQN